MNVIQAPPRGTLLILSWLARLTAAIILLQTLYFKFTGAPESVHIFTTLGLEPWGRYGSGLAELAAGLLLLHPRTCWAGAAMALGIMAGAIASHLTVLGIAVQNDGGLLFGLAVTVAGTSALTLHLHRHEMITTVHRFTGCTDACSLPKPNP